MLNTIGILLRVGCLLVLHLTVTRTEPYPDERIDSSGNSIPNTDKAVAANDIPCASVAPSIDLKNHAPKLLMRTAVRVTPDTVSSNVIRMFSCNMLPHS